MPSRLGIVIHRLQHEKAADIAQKHGMPHEGGNAGACHVQQGEWEMDHVSVAVLGFAAIGLVVTGIVYAMTMTRVSDRMQRRVALRWIVSFGLSMCTFMSITPLLATHGHMWVLVMPLVGTWLSLDSLHGIGGAATTCRSGGVSTPGGSRGAAADASSRSP